MKGSGEASPVRTAQNKHKASENQGLCYFIEIKLYAYSCAYHLSREVVNKKETPAWINLFFLLLISPNPSLFNINTYI